jgi:plastocyanin
MADVTGKVTFNGPPPKPKQINMKGVPQCAALHVNPVFDPSIEIGPAGELSNVVVYVKDGGKLGGAVPKDPVVLDQKGCMYEPHVVTVMVGQQLQAKNSDGFLHNVHGLGRKNPQFNFPQQAVGQVNPINVKQVETFKIKCDVHPWMSAWVVVLDHPYSAVTDAKGTFTIKGLKNGKYTLVAWQEKLGTQEMKIEVKNGDATADFKFAKKKN